MRRSALSLWLLLASTSAVAAQTPAPVPQGAFAGFLKSTIDAVPIRLGDIRLYFIDSTKEITGSRGVKTVDTFVDTLRSRIAASDSTGYFAIWRLAPGAYLMQMRRIGFRPIEAVVRVDSTTLFHEFRLEPIAAILNQVEIRDVAVTSLSKRLDFVGFMTRKRRNANAADFLTRGEIDKTRSHTLRDILARYGIYNRTNADFLVDRMALGYDDIQDYPAELIAAVEIYRHGKPFEFNTTRPSPGIMDRGGDSFLRRPLVVIWTYIP